MTQPNASEPLDEALDLTPSSVLAALSKYGRHVRGCSVLMPTDSAHCSCGLAAALDDLRAAIASQPEPLDARIDAIAAELIGVEASLDQARGRLRRLIALIPEEPR